MAGVKHYTVTVDVVWPEEMGSPTASDLYTEAFSVLRRRESRSSRERLGIMELRPVLPKRIRRDDDYGQGAAE